MKMGESVALFQLEGETSFCLAREYGSSRLVFSIAEGDSMELHASAVGRVLLAHGPQELVQSILNKPTLEKFTSKTIINPAKLKKELALVKKKGYAINRGETEPEVAAIAAPIFNYENKVESALAIVGPIQRFSEERETAILENLFKASSKISTLLGAPPRPSMK